MDIIKYSFIKRRGCPISYKGAIYKPVLSEAVANDKSPTCCPALLLFLSTELPLVFPLTPPMQIPQKKHIYRFQPLCPCT